MILRTFDAAWKVLWHPTILVPSALATVGAHLAYGAIGADAGFWMVSPPGMWLLALVVCARFWIGLSVSVVALDIIRAGFHWRPFRFVSSSIALQAAVVSAALVLPVAAATLVFIVPGIFLAVRWSQAAMLIADGHSTWFGSAEDSAHLVHGRRLEIFSIWLIVGAALALVAWLQHAAVGLAGVVHAPAFVLETIALFVRIAVDAFSLVLVGAMYHELDMEASVVDAPSAPRAARPADPAEEPVTWQ